jgi:hypothetical protein
MAVRDPHCCPTTAPYRSAVRPTIAPSSVIGRPCAKPNSDDCLVPFNSTSAVRPFQITVQRVLPLSHPPHRRMSLATQPATSTTVPSASSSVLLPTLPDLARRRTALTVSSFDCCMLKEREGKISCTSAVDRLQLRLPRPPRRRRSRPCLDRWCPPNVRPAARRRQPDQRTANHEPFANSSPAASSERLSPSSSHLTLT